MWNKYSKYVLVALLVIILVLLLKHFTQINTTDKQIEHNNCKIDSIEVVNHKIKVQIEHLDSIKDAKVIEVRSLDNDSTIKLFFELVAN